MATRSILPSAFLFLWLAGFLASPQAAFAARSEAGESALKFLDATAEKAGLKSGDVGESSEDEVLGIIGNIINVILGFVGIIFFIQLFWAGFRWMSSGGNEEVVTEARQTIKTAVIGMVVVFAAFVVTNFTLNQIGSITGQQARPTPPAAPSGPVLGICKYPQSTHECGDQTIWLEHFDDITEQDCQRLSPVSCSPNPNYAWTPKP
ncbi:MAG: hypothetical protein HYW81_03025 [Parcubacteria group bacterium]|nr:hypothetical protein [Parcubacteria group bacterium]